MKENTVEPIAIQKAASTASSMKSCPVLFTLNIGIGDPLMAHPEAQAKINKAQAAVVTSPVTVLIKLTMPAPPILDQNNIQASN
jgi:hypothetical protein